MRKISFETNVPAPYRRHQFELFSRAFPGCIIYLTGRQATYRPWSDSVDGWHCEVRQVTPWRLVRNLIFQPWGSVHVYAGVGGRTYWLLLMLSGMIGHSVVINWLDGTTAAAVESATRAERSNPSLRRRLLTWLSKSGRRGIFVSGRNGAQWARAVGYKEWQIVNAYLSHDMEKFSTFEASCRDEERSRIRRERGIAVGKTLLLCISRYLDCKRLEDVAEALTILERNKPGVACQLEFALIGEGEWKAHVPILKALRLVKVHLVANMPPDDVMSWYCASDIFVFPSEGDVWGLVVNEALSMGLPVICTSAIGAAELVEDSVNGYVVPPRRPDLIAAKVEELLRGGRLEKFSAAAKEIRNTWRSDMGVAALAKFIAQLG